MPRNRRRIRLVHQHMEGYGRDRPVGKPPFFHRGHELYPRIGHLDIDLRILVLQILRTVPGGSVNKARAPVAHGQHNMRTAVMKDPAERKEPACERSGIIDTAAVLCPEVAGTAAVSMMP